MQLLAIMGEFTPDEQRSFLRFVTGAPRLPPGGLSALTPRLTIVRKVRPHRWGACPLEAHSYSPGSAAPEVAYGQVLDAGLMWWFHADLPGRAESDAALGLGVQHPSGGTPSATLGSTPPGSALAPGTTLADGDLPSVMTCANYLKLPPYSCKVSPAPPRSGAEHLGGDAAMLLCPVTSALCFSACSCCPLIMHVFFKPKPSSWTKEV